MDDIKNKVEDAAKDKEIQSTDIYKALEAMVTIEVTKISEYIGKRKDAKTRTSKSHYDKKIKKSKDKALKYMFQLKKLTGKNIDDSTVEDILDDIENDNKTGRE